MSLEFALKPEFDVNQNMTPEINGLFLNDSVKGKILYEVVGKDKESVRLRIKGIYIENRRVK